MERRVTVLPTSHVCFLQIFRSTDCQLDMRVCNDDQIKCIVGEVMTGLSKQHSSLCIYFGLGLSFICIIMVLLWWRDLLHCGWRCH